MKVLIIDNYDSFVYILAHYVGELGYEPLVRRINKITLKEVTELNPDRIIISSGPEKPTDRRYFGVCPEILLNLSIKVPTLGIGMGHQGIVCVFGGRTIPAKRIMHGKVSLVLHDGRGIFKDVENPFRAARYNSLVCDESSLPPCFEITARSIEDGEIMGVRHRAYPIEGIQFHPESILTSEGRKIIGNFLKWVREL
ncbi:MAG: aminodeoxychorismate/anthranilate synthase component II [Candidatus Bathyarchaeia archaeon]